MKIIFATLLLLSLSIVAAAQQMTDSGLAWLKDKVKQVKVWRQKYGPDGKPVGKPEPEPEMNYDPEGNIQLTRYWDDKGEIRTTYFLYKGDRVSKLEFIPERSLDKPKLPPNVNFQIIKNKGPYDTKYKYKYDKQGRIVEAVESRPNYPTKDVIKYDYDPEGRIALETNNSGINKIVTSFKYDQAGNMIESVNKSEEHIVRNIAELTNELPKPTIESSTSQYSDYILDAKGNWIKRTAVVRNEKGEAESLTIEVREITYY
jgi:YD repeat-containing protein